MALWRKDAKLNNRWKRKLKKEPNEDLIRHNSFFISEGGKGVCIDYVERRQAAQRMRIKEKTP